MSGVTGHTASASKIHYAGHKGSCATALSVPLTPGRHTWNPSDVTCKRCLTELRRLLSDEDVPVEDPTPWCSGCGAMTRAKCDCGPIAENE